MSMYVRVRPDVMAISDTFVYAVPESMVGQISVGALVRVEMHRRRVNGWVIDVDVEPEPTRKYRDLLAVRSVGPPENVLALADWAAWRWSGQSAAFLDAASPDTMVKSLSITPAKQETYKTHGTKIVERAPHEQKGDLLLEAASHANALLLFPTFDQVKGAQSFLRDAGIHALRYPDDWAAIRSKGGVVVGTRRAAWAPLEHVDAVAVIDAHDHRFIEERAPTWSAVDVVVERARRDGATATLISPCPTVIQTESFDVDQTNREAERRGWPEAEVVDMRDEDPRSGLWSKALTKHLRSQSRVVCILNRKGRAQLLLCEACSNVAVCEKCGAHVHEVDGESSKQLICQRCDTVRPRVCQHCHSQKLKRRRIGVTRAREELEALVGEPVGEITKDSGDVASTRVMVGTEAILYRLHERADVVAFIDFDQELLAPVVGASERAMALCARAARVVPPRGKDGTLLVQTRVPEHEVVEALIYGDPARVRKEELARRRVLSLPPFSAIALVEGKGAPEFVQQLPSEIDVLGPREEKYLVRGTSHQVLCDALEKCVRPSERVRVAVDPLWF